MTGIVALILRENTDPVKEKQGRNVTPHLSCLVKYTHTNQNDWLLPVLGRDKS